MKIKNFLLLLFCSVATASCCMNKDMATPSVIPQEFLDAINNSNSVKWYLIDAACGNAEKACSMHDYGNIVFAFDETNPNRKKFITDTLTARDSFEIHEMSKNSTFMPDVAIVFIAGSDTVEVMYSFYCDVCRFFKSGFYMDFDGEKVRNPLMSVLSEIFPQDKCFIKLK